MKLIINNIENRLMSHLRTLTVTSCFAFFEFLRVANMCRKIRWRWGTFKEDWVLWRALGEVHVQQWTGTGWCWRWGNLSNIFLFSFSNREVSGKSWIYYLWQQAIHIKFILFCQNKLPVFIISTFKFSVSLNQTTKMHWLRFVICSCPCIW